MSASTTTSERHAKATAIAGRDNAKSDEHATRFDAALDMARRCGRALSPEETQKIWSRVEAGDGAEEAFSKIGLASQWDSLVETYQSRRAARLAVSRRSSNLYVERRYGSCHSALLAPALNHRLSLRWSHQEDIERDLLLTKTEKAHLTTQLAAFRAEPYAAPAEEGDLDEEVEILDLAESEAEDAMLEAGAPDLTAVLYKHRVVVRETDESKLGYDDLGLFCFHRSALFAEQSAAQQFIDLALLAGLDHPALHLEDFNPGQWVRDFEAAGGRVVSQARDVAFLDPPIGEPDDLAAARSVFEDLASTPWKLRAVVLHAENRRASGGDGYYTSHGAPRTDAPRHRITGGYRVRFYDPGRPAPVWSIAEHDIEAMVERVELAPAHPTTLDFAKTAQGSDAMGRLMEAARHTPQGRAALAEFHSFDPYDFVDRVDADPHHYFARFGHLYRYDPACLGQGFLTGRMLSEIGGAMPLALEWEAMSDWQKILCRTEANTRPCRLEIETAVQRFMSAVTREAMTSPYDSARMCAIRDGRLTDEEVAIFDQRMAEAWLASFEAAGGKIEIGADGSALIGGPMPMTGLLRRLFDACEDELKEGVVELAKARAIGGAA